VHALTRSACYAQIARLKQARAASAEDFFPGVAGSEFLRTREAVAARLAGPEPDGG